MNDKYNEIIKVKYIKSTKHPHMTLKQRSSQFMPFSALTGYNESIIEKSRITDKKRILSIDEKNIINNKLNYLTDNLDKQISVIYFVKDIIKNGGEYLEKTGYIKVIDSINKIIKFKDKTIINFIDIFDIKIIE